MLRPCIGAAVRQIIPKTSFCAIVFLTGIALASNAETIPVPRERPPVSEDRSSAPKIEFERSPCQLQLAEVAEFKPEPPITGPGECTATDVVNVTAVLLQDRHRVVFSPAVTLRCSMAEAVAHWIRDDVTPTIGMLGMSLRGVETLDSFDCRSFNGISGAKLSEHGRANALDLRSFKLANGVVIELTDASTTKSLRERLRDSACARFSTVLGNGADAYHENHVHIDLMQRSNDYRICQWDVLDPAETAALVAKKAAAAAARVSAAMKEASDVPLPRARPVVDTDAVIFSRHSVPAPIFKERTMGTPSALSLAGSLAASALGYAEEQTVTVGSWTIATSYKGDKFDGCSMSRSTDELDITFLRAQDGLLLLLDSQKWKLERGKAYAVRLVAGSRSVEAKALAENKAVTIALVDRSLDERLRIADALEVRGEGATLRVPLDGSTAALGRLEACFDKNNRAGVETNPFVSPKGIP
jgi:Extensin-like protein C-terminus